MEGEHTPTIIQLIRSTDLAIIQLKDSHSYSSIPTGNTCIIYVIHFTNPAWLCKIKDPNTNTSWQFEEATSSKMIALNYSSDYYTREQKHVQSPQQSK